MDFITLAKERYSCRKLSEKPVEREKIETILEAAILAPTAKMHSRFGFGFLKGKRVLTSYRRSRLLLLGQRSFLS